MSVRWKDRLESAKYLQEIEANDRHGFLQSIGGNWDNHRPLLLLALSLTTGKILELGCGDGSTHHLHKFCEMNGRPLLSVETDKKWLGKFQHYNEDQKSTFHSLQFAKDEAAIESLIESAGPWGLAFVDHAPGEHRKVAIERMIDRADIIVVHDSEQGGAGDYQLEPVLSKFSYRLNYNKNGGGAGATAVSNKTDLNQFRGLSLGQYQFDND